MKKVKLGVVSSKHGTEDVVGCVFQDFDDITVAKMESLAQKRLLEYFPDQRGELHLYIDTKLIVAVLAAINAAKILGIGVIICQYDERRGCYFQQRMR